MGERTRKRRSGNSELRNVCGEAGDDAATYDGFESAVGGSYTAIEQTALRYKDRGRQLLLEKQVR